MNKQEYLRLLRLLSSLETLLLLINRANGVAVLGIYQAKHQWTHWQGLPKFAEDNQS